LILEKYLITTIIKLKIIQKIHKKSIKGNLFLEIYKNGKKKKTENLYGTHTNISKKKKKWKYLYGSHTNIFGKKKKWKYLYGSHTNIFGKKKKKSGCFLHFQLRKFLKMGSNILRK
jgi:hypothetical protein